jgi:gluconolactonase
MKQKTALVILSWLSGSAILSSQALAQALPGQAPPAQASSCIPPAQPQAQSGAGRGQGTAGAGRGQPAPPAPAPRNIAARNPAIMAIPGVVAAGGQWTKVWQAGGNSADGIIPDKDGGVLVAQEDFDTVLQIDESGKASVALANAKGVGSISIDPQGLLYGAHRTERAGSTKADLASIVNAITVLAPERRTIADKWADGTELTVRPNDLTADGHGGAYFTVGCLYYAGPKGVTVAAENLRTNGIVFSPDEKTLYVTNGGAVVAFEVMGPGLLTNRRDFATLQAGSIGDGMVVDSEGRIYVSSNPGLQLFDKTGRYLGLIPTPRSVISVTFAGTGRQTLFIVGSGADDENGQPIREGPQQTAATIYKLPLIAQGLTGRAK